MENKTARCPLKPAFTFTATMLLGCLGLAGIAFSADIPQPKNATNITVEVLIFSGRPNPTFELGDVGLGMMKGKIENLEILKEEPPGWSRLGFAGFRIWGAETIGLPGEIRVFQGVTQTRKGKEVKYRKDLAGLERLLLKEAKKRELEPPVMAAVKAYEMQLGR